MKYQRVANKTEQQKRTQPSQSSALQSRDAGNTLLQLQQTVGNQVFQQLLRTGVLQANFVDSRPGDRQEQVAEQVEHLAQQVMRLRRRQPVKQEGNAPLVLAPATPPPIPEVTPAAQGRNDAVRSGGQPKRAADSETASAPLIKQETEALPAVEGAAEEGAAAAAVVKESLQPPAPLEKAPANPEEDTAYQAVAEQVEANAKHEKTPAKKPEQKQRETKLAANLSPEKITEQNAYYTHLKAMEQVPTHEFTVEQFIAEFKATSDKLADKLPENKEKHGTVQATVEFAAGKAAATQEVSKQNKAYSDRLRTEARKDASEYEKKTRESKTYELKADPAGSAPTIKQAATAAPKPKKEDEISLDDHSRALDDALLNHSVSGQTINIDEGSLAFPRSGEKTFDEAGEAKRKAQDEIEKAKPRYREKEMGEIGKAQDEIQSLVSAGLQGYHHSRSKSFDAVLDSQRKHEGNIEGEKGDFFNEFQSIYAETKRLVDEKLSELSGIEETFENILRKAGERFESSIRTELEYIYTPGYFDYSDWKDKHESEIKAEFEKLLSGGEYSFHERLGLQMKAMGIVRDRSAATFFRYAKWEFSYNVTTEVREQIANKVVGALKAAKKDIKDGEDRVKEAYKRLPPKEQEEATKVLGAVEGQFQTLKESVEDRQLEIVNDMARTYNQSVGKLQTTFDAIKEDVLTSWFEKAWNKLKAIVNAIIDFATRIAELLGRIAYLVGDIVASPRYFFKNLVTGIGQGFSTFVERIDEFLATAFFDWLRGASGIQIQLPKDWGPKGIFSLFTQLLNLSTETIWERMEVVYDKTIANAFRRGEVLLGKGLEIIGIIKNEGLGGLWDHIKESLGNILEDTLGMIKETVLYAAIKKVIIEIGKLLVPGGGFIAIAEKVIRLLQFIVEARNKILDLIESFVDSMVEAVKGNIPGIVKLITRALTKFITIALDFLVNFFGLGRLKEKVERFIERVKKPVIRGIDWVLNKFKPIVMKMMKKGKELLAKGKAALGLGGKPAAEEMEIQKTKEEEAKPDLSVAKSTVKDALKTQLPKGARQEADVSKVLAIVAPRVRPTLTNLKAEEFQPGKPKEEGAIGFKVKAKGEKNADLLIDAVRYSKEGVAISPEERWKIGVEGVKKSVVVLVKREISEEIIKAQFPRWQTEFGFRVLSLNTKEMPWMIEGEMSPAKPITPIELEALYKTPAVFKTPEEMEADKTEVKNLLDIAHSGYAKGWAGRAAVITEIHKMQLNKTKAGPVGPHIVYEGRQRKNGTYIADIRGGIGLFKTFSKVWRIAQVIPQTHHIASREGATEETNFQFHPAFNKKYGLDIEHSENKIDLYGHAGPHSASYHDRVRQVLDEAVRQAGGPTSPKLQAEVIKALQQLRNEIISGDLRLYTDKEVWI